MGYSLSTNTLEILEIMFSSVTTAIQLWELKLARAKGLNESNFHVSESDQFHFEDLKFRNVFFKAKVSNVKMPQKMQGAGSADGRIHQLSFHRLFRVFGIYRELLQIRSYSFSVQG